MVAAGIKTPVPLEELEIHLREEIERHTRSGSNEAEAFKAAVEKIGPAHVLQKEFMKVDKDHKTMRAILLIIGWLAASCTLLYSLFRWEFNWNFFTFSPKWNLELIAEMLGVLVADVAIWFLAKASRDKASRAVSLLVCVLLAGLAVAVLHEDEHARGMFGGPRTIPLWYRGGRTLLLCVPSVFWIWWTRRHLAQRYGPTRGNQSVPSH
jgi:hypothetical protein